MHDYIYWCIIGVLVAGLIVFFIKWLLLRKQMRNDNVEEEIISMVDEGFEQGVLENSEAEMIHNIFEFGDKQVQEIMTNRSNISAIDAESTFAEAKEIMISLPYSRYPVYFGDLDHIIGVLHLKDVVRYLSEGRDENEPIKSNKKLLRKTIYIQETKDVDDLFRKMQSERIQFAVVLDEYGQTAGIITMEDLLEEIVGNILDEYDIKEEQIGARGRDEYEVDGLAPLEDLEEVLGISLKTDDYETLNGFLTDRLTHVPTEEDVGFTFNFEGYSFEILSVDKHIIEKTRVKKLPKEENDKELLNDSVKNDNI